MDVREPLERRSPRIAPTPAIAILLTLGTLALAGCRETVAPGGGAPLPPATVIPPPMAVPETPADPPAPPTPPIPGDSGAVDPGTTYSATGEPITPAIDPERERTKTLIVIDPANDPAADEAKDLAEAARREKERRRSSEVPIAVIDQKNLAKWAKGGVLTETKGMTPTVEENAASEMVEKAAVEEQYWRRRGREIRKKWRDAHDQVAVLEAKTEALRTKFYSTDDGYVRDSQVKPEWDKSIADLEDARYTSSRGAAEVLAFLEEGRRAGALPGWLRDGVELEPEPVIEDAEPGSPLDSQEPVIYREPENTEDLAQPPPAPARPDDRRQ